MPIAIYKAAKKTVADEVHTLLEHVHKQDDCWPIGEVGVGVVSHLDAWTLGNYAELVAVGDITEVFDIHHINIEGISEDGTYILELYAETTFIGRRRFTSTSFANVVWWPEVSFMCPQLAANSQVQAKVMSSNAASADTITISVQYHTY